MGDKMAGQRRARCRERGGVDDQDGVDAILLQHAVQRLLIGGDGGIAADIERRASQLAASLQQHIYRHIGQPATVGDDGEPLPLEGHGVAEGFDRGEQFVGITYPQHTGAADGGIIDIVETVGRFVAPAFQHQDRLVARGCPRRGEKVAGVVQLVHIDQNGAGDAVAGELIQQLAEVDIAVIAKGDKGGKAQFMLLGPIENGGADGGGLRQKGDLPRLGGNGGKAGVDPLAGQQHPHAVGAEQANAILLADPFQLQPLLGRKVGGQYDGRPRALLAERIQQRQDPLPPGTDDGEVRCQRQAGDIGIGQHAGDGLVARGDGEDGPFGTGPPAGGARSHDPP